MKSWVKTLLALLVLAGVGTYVALYETAPKDDRGERIWSVKPERVVKFTLKDLATGVGLTCERKAGAWRITAPADLEADPEAAELAARHLGEPELERRLEPAADLGPFGLAEPSYRASFTDANGRTRTLLIGRKNPTDTAWFAIDEGGKAPFTILSWSADNFRKTIADLRAKDLVRLDPAAVTRLLIRRKVGGVIEAVRGAGDRWSLVQPVKGDADRFAIQGLLDAAKALRGVEVVEDPVAFSRYKLDQPTAELVFTTPAGTQTLTLSRPRPAQPDTFASSTRLPFTWKVGTAPMLTDALKPVEEFRDRLLLQMDQETLKEADVTFGGVRYAATLGRDGKWSVAAPAGAGPADAELHDLLFELVYVRAEAFVDDAPKSLKPYGLAPPQADVTLRGLQDGKPVTAHYLLGGAFGARVYVKFADRPSVYGARKDLLDKLARFADKVRTAPVKPATTARKK